MRPDFDDTIAAVATPLGEAGLGVIRLSGPAALSIADKLFEARRPLSAAATHTLHHGWITRSSRRLDEAVAAVFRAPTSYTGRRRRGIFLPRVARGPARAPRVVL